MVSSLAAQTVKNGTATVVRLKGAARYSTGNGVWQPLDKVGTILKSGTLIQTAANSTVDLVLGEGEAIPAQPVIGEMLYNQPAAEQNVVRLFADTTLAIDKLTSEVTGADTVTETQLDLRQGRIFGTVRKLSAASHYEIKTPNGVAGIRGTIYMIGVDGIVTVLSGSVVISWVGTDGTVHTEQVSAGHQFNLVTGELTTLPPLTIGELVSLLREVRIITTRPTVVAVDKTVYYVSPTTARPPPTPGGLGEGLVFGPVALQR
jgi:hypothetical protein